MALATAEFTAAEEVASQIDDLAGVVSSYLAADQVEALRRACVFAAEAHSGQRRASGEPYVTHPIAVAKLLAEVHFDHATLMAAVLHDVVEDTRFSHKDIAENFGDEVAALVDGVTKLTQIRFASRNEARAENFQKMFLAMSKDIRVLMVKLADRLHNMRTLGALHPAKRRRIAHETLEIYAPIAGRLGMNYLRLQLENLGFQALYPLRFRTLSEQVRGARGNRKEILSQIEDRIRMRIQEEGIHAKVLGREKHLWGIYKKMRTKRLPFSEVYDVYAFRIIVDNVDTCYRVLGIVHNLYKPHFGRFKDYVAIPKANGYQSLHTVLFGPHGVPIEVQVRTREMHIMAETGVASHWIYKNPETVDSGPQQRAREWLKRVLEMHKRAGDSVEFLENVKVDLFPDEVYVFTPKGQIIELPRGATAVDFAYAIHSDVGNHCVAAKINRRLASLRTQLDSGQTVEIITARTGRPNPSWLGFVATAKARSSIHHFLKKLQHEDAVVLGRRMLDKALLDFGATLKDIPPGRIAQLVVSLAASDFDQVLVDLGLGKRLAPLVARRLLPSEDHERESTTTEGSPHTNSQPLAIKGTEGTVVNFARCCRPIPGDLVVGQLTSGKGIVVHRTICKNLRDKSADRLLDVVWADGVDQDFQAEIRLETNNQRGVLATVAASIADSDSNISNVSLDEREGNVTSMSFVVGVRSRVHLARVMRRLRSLPQVLRITRIN
jgi:GTP pyrophosphokinase/guanosine-3',5'-bis(diphosphate) 3'-pyrophosphohydrolase